MVRGLRIAVVVLVGSGVLCLAQDPPVSRRAAPPGAPLKADQPTRGTPDGGGESAAVLAARVEVRKAHRRAAEVALRGARGKLARVTRERAAGTATAEDVERAGLEVEAAAAQFDICTAEVGEAEARAKRVPEPPAGPPVGVFNMAAVMRGYDRAKYQVYVLNQKRVAESATATRKRAEYARVEKRLAGEAADDGKEKLARELKVLAKEIQDEDARVNKMLNKEASGIISHLYDEIKKVVAEAAEKKGCRLVLAYPDAVTDEEERNPYLKELKLKPPAAQPFFVAKSADLTDDVLTRLNDKYPAVDADGKRVDTSKLPPLEGLPGMPTGPKRD